MPRPRTTAGFTAGSAFSAAETGWSSADTRNILFEENMSKLPAAAVSCSQENVPALKRVMSS